MKILSVFLRLCGSLLILAVFAVGQAKDHTRWVNPFIGTGGHGHTFPGATVPFGMVQLSPDTRIDNWDGSSGYHYSDNTIYGFSHTHLSGTGIPDGCDILLIPSTDDAGFNTRSGPIQPRYSMEFSHENEKAEPGYYSVLLKNGIRTELSSTSRVGIHRYSFPDDGEMNLLVDLNWRDKVLDSKVSVSGKNRIEGYRESGSWAKKQKVYFVIEFSEASLLTEIKSSSGTDNRGSVRIHKPEIRTASGESLVTKSTFRRSRNKNQLIVKVALSYVSIEGARKNLEAELPHWDFDKVRADAKAAWNKELSKIEVSGGTDEQTTNFYTALYHTMIHPNVFNDVDGRYNGHDGKIHQLPGYGVSSPHGGKGSRQNIGRQRLQRQAATKRPPAYTGGSASEHYTVFSLWDTFRAAHPLYTIIDQKRTADLINTFIRIYEQGGRLPVWELWGEETDTMIGYHAVSVIADAMAKGIEGFDYEKAYKAAKHSAELDHFGLAAYKKRGYISAEDENESVSKTLEYAYNDWCIAQMGEIVFQRRVRDHQINQETGKLKDEIAKYKARAGYFENLFDPETDFMSPKRNGGFIKPFAPNEVTFHFTEGNSWQYTFFAPHDLGRLMDLMGGREKFAAKLDELFTTDQKLTGRFQPDITGLIGQYAHGNEPSHHIPYLYNYAGQPWKTQKYVRKIMDEFYKNAPDGLIGNEDCGQMSAWFISSAAGFYPVAPGSPTYAVGTPLFEEVRFNLENGKTFVVRAPNVSGKNFYVSSVRLNGRPHESFLLEHKDVLSGGTLEFSMANKPNEKALTAWRPMTDLNRRPPVPTINGDRVFRNKTTVRIDSMVPGARITYTVDGLGEEYARKTREYTGPFEIDVTSKVEAYVTVPGRNQESLKTEAIFTKRPNDWTVKLLSRYSTQYPGGGDDAIIDGLRGNQNFASGEWQGYQGKTFEAVIDLQNEGEIKEVGGSFLQSVGSWIWMPDRLEFEVSDDGVSFTRVADWRPGFPQSEMKGTTKEFLQKMSPVKGRYVRVRAHNFGKIPAWHPGAGGDPWIFVDEIFVR